MLTLGLEAHYAVQGSQWYLTVFPIAYVENRYGRVLALGDIPLRRADMPLGFDE